MPLESNHACETYLPFMSLQWMGQCPWWKGNKSDMFPEGSWYRWSQGHQHGREHVSVRVMLVQGKRHCEHLCWIKLPWDCLSNYALSRKRWCICGCIQYYTIFLNFSNTCKKILNLSNTFTYLKKKKNYRMFKR